MTETRRLAQEKAIQRLLGLDHGVEKGDPGLAGDVEWTVELEPTQALHAALQSGEVVIVDASAEIEQELLDVGREVGDAGVGRGVQLCNAQR